MVIVPAFWMRFKVSRQRRLFDLMGGNKNCNAQNFLTNTYGYFTSLQKFHHAELAIGGLVVTSPRTNHYLRTDWLTNSQHGKKENLWACVRRNRLNAKYR